MPELDGLEVCRKLRAKQPVPILFLSSRDDELDRVLGLELGADDYVTKPFSPRELVARVKALLRRAAAPSEPATPGAAAARRADARSGAPPAAPGATREVVLTVTEFALLRSLMGTPGRSTRAASWSTAPRATATTITERTVDSHIRRIRQKLADAGADPIETVYGVGYRLREQ